jgi:DNA-binding beta-propeller fold protein YncE
MRLFHPKLSSVIVSLGTTILPLATIACGGGGGGGNGSSAAVLPTITTQPVDQTGAAGQNVSFAVTASGTPTPTFQWQRSPDGATWSDIAGGTSSTYTFTAQLTDTGAKFRAKATNSAGSATSNTATLTVVTPTLVWSNNGPAWGIATDTKGHVIVSSFLQNTVQEFMSTGTPVFSWGSSGTGNGQFSAPKYIATDGSGNIYVADNGNARVQKFDPNGNYTLQIGSYGTGNGQFNGPAGLAVDMTNGWIYVQDSNNNRVEKFDLSGNYIGQWGTFGTGNGQFRFVILGDLSGGPEGGLAVDGNGNVYVVDTMNCRIQKFASDGTYLTQWGSQGSGDAQFLFPSGIAVDKSRNRVYVVDNSTANNTTGNVCKVAIFDLSGNYLGQWAPMSLAGLAESSIGIATDSSGAIYVAQGNSVGKYIE